MSSHFQRALLLFRQSRTEQAAHELRRHLADRPNDAVAHAILGTCLARLDQLDEAQAEAEQAIALAPDEPYAHYCRSLVMEHRHRFREAESAAREAIRLEPRNANYYGRLAATLFAQGRWQETFETAMEGLALDPDDDACANLRTMALTKLGRQAEAVSSVDERLGKSPEDAMAHANKGWALLHNGDPKGALDHFRESLRLDPTFEYAQAGVVEALKARNPLYRFMLGYFLWMSRLSSRAKWGVILGGWFGARLLRNVTRQNPDLTVWTTPLLVLYLVFVLLTWFSVPLFNLLLRLNKYGRHALSRDQRVSSNWFAACILLLVVSGAGAFLTGDDMLIMLAVFGLGMALPLTTTYHCDAGWPRKAMGWYSIAMAAVGVSGLAGMALDRVGVLSEPPWTNGCMIAFLLGAIGSPWAANWFVSATPAR